MFLRPMKTCTELYSEEGGIKSQIPRMEKLFLGDEFTKIRLSKPLWRATSGKSYFGSR